jgi:hypothetical protein
MQLTCPATVRDLILELFTAGINRDNVENRMTQSLSATRKSGAELAVEIKVLQTQWASINILPWHSDLAVFKDDYTDHLNSWIARGEFFGSLSNWEALQTFETHQTSSDISATFRIAEASGKNPYIPMFASNAENRIETIFRD